MIERRTILKAALGLPAIMATAPALGMSRRPPFTEYRDYDGLGLARLVADKEVDARELLRSAIEAAETVNPRINALAARMYDFGHQAIQDGLPDGPFRGVPFLVKDLHLMIEGHVTANGSRFWRDNVADQDIGCRRDAEQLR